MNALSFNVPTFKDQLLLMIYTHDNGNTRYANAIAYHLSSTLTKQDIVITLDMVRISGLCLLIKHMKTLGMIQQ